MTLRVADNKTGYFGVKHQLARPKPYQARVKRGGKEVNLGSFATAEELVSFFSAPRGEVCESLARQR